MSAPAAIPPADVVWPTPMVHSVNGALDAASCLAERLSALFDSNTDDMQASLLEDEDLSERLRTRAYSVWMIYVLAGEKLTELQTLIGAITEAVYAEPKTAIGKHVDLRRRSLFAERLQAFRDADAVPMPVNADDATFDAIAIPCSEALLAFVGTRSPDIRSLHEKLTLIMQQGALHTNGVVDGIMSDVEYLARRYEIDGPSAAEAEG